MYNGEKVGTSLFYNDNEEIINCDFNNVEKEISIREGTQEIKLKFWQIKRLNRAINNNLRAGK
jgi:hypothetical protein